MQSVIAKAVEDATRAVISNIFSGGAMPCPMGGAMLPYPTGRALPCSIDAPPHYGGGSGGSGASYRYGGSGAASYGAAAPSYRDGGGSGASYRDGGVGSYRDGGASGGSGASYRDGAAAPSYSGGTASYREEAVAPPTDSSLYWKLPSRNDKAFDGNILYVTFNKNRFVKYLKSFLMPDHIRPHMKALHYPCTNHPLTDYTEKELGAISDHEISGMIRVMVKYLRPVFANPANITGLTNAIAAFGFRIDTLDYAIDTKYYNLPDKFITFASRMQHVLLQRLHEVFTHDFTQRDFHYSFEGCADVSNPFRLLFREHRDMARFLDVLNTRV